MEGSAKDADVRREMSASGHLGLLLGGGASYWDEEACYFLHIGWRCFGLYSWKHGNQQQSANNIRNQIEN